MTHYELLALISGQYTDDEVGAIHTQLVELLKKEGAEITRQESLGRIKLAYAINRVRHGSYLLTQFKAEPSTIKEINRRLGLTDEVLRHTLVKTPKGAETRTFTLTSYVAPLSDEARASSMARDAFRKRSSKDEESTSSEESKTEVASKDVDTLLEADVATLT